eukprot:5383804-Pleurochrysis_carterae.AAC.1
MRVAPHHRAGSARTARRPKDSCPMSRRVPHGTRKSQRAHCCPRQSLRLVTPRLRRGRHNFTPCLQVVSGIIKND